MKKNLELILCLAALVAGWTLFHYRMLFLDHTEVLLDASRFFYPLWAWGAGVIQQGLIPLWNPDAAFGTPYLADPDMAAWYPPLRLVYFLFSPETAFSLLTVVHHLWALFGFFLFARNRGFSPLVALAGCLVFGFSFNAVSLAWITAILFAFSWIPWVFLAADRLREGKKGSFFLLATAFSMQLASGYPLYAYLTGLAVAGDWFLRWCFGGNRMPQIKEWTPKIAWGVLTVGLAVGFNAAWLLPLKEMIPYSNLIFRLDNLEANEWSNLATWFNPFFRGHPLFSHPQNPFSYTVYFAGLPTVVLVLWGVLRKKVSKVSLWLFLALLVLSLGDRAKVATVLKALLPGYEFVVRSGYWISLVIFISAILSMEALAVFVQEKNGRPAIWMFLTGLVYLSALGLGVPWDLLTFWLSLLLLAAAGFSYSKSFPTYGRPLLVLLALAFSLGPVVRGIHFTMERSYYDKPKVLGNMPMPGRIYHSYKTVDSFQAVSGNNVSDIEEKQKEALVPNWPLGYGREEVAYSNPLFLDSFIQSYLMFDGFPSKLKQTYLDYFGVRYIVENGNGIKISENRDAIPKWFSVKEAISETPENSDVYLGPLAQVDNFQRECTISNYEKIGPYSPRQVRETFRTLSGLGLEATGSGKALLVSSETAYPGWAAAVKGNQRPLELVNGGFRGLVLNDGEEEAVLNYRPVSFRLGCFLSLLVCGVWLAGLFKLGLLRR